MTLYYATPNTAEVFEAIESGRLGAILTPESWKGKHGKAARFPTIALDNGCFSRRWIEAKWLRWLGGLTPLRERVAFAVVPDVLADAAATAKRWRRYAPIVRELGFPLAYVAQNGLSIDDVPWPELDCLFVGGDDAWKLSEPAYAIAAEAKRRGKTAHLGRVNSKRRLRAARISGFDSVDGTFLRWPDENLPRLLKWLDDLDRTPHLPLFEASS